MSHLEPSKLPVRQKGCCLPEVSYRDLVGEMPAVLDIAHGEAGVSSEVVFNGVLLLLG